MFVFLTLKDPREGFRCVRVFDTEGPQERVSSVFVFDTEGPVGGFPVCSVSTIFLQHLISSIIFVNWLIWYEW